MLDKNTLTFNPGWDQNAEPVTKLTDIRVIQRQLKSQGVALTATADEITTGPAYAILLDPDGNPVFLDQHV